MTIDMLESETSLFLRITITHTSETKQAPAAEPWECFELSLFFLFQNLQL